MGEFTTALCERCQIRFPCTTRFPAFMRSRGEPVLCRPCREQHDREGK